MEFKIKFDLIKSDVEKIACPVHGEYATLIVKSENNFSIKGCCEDFVRELTKKTQSEIANQTKQYFIKITNSLKQ